MSKEKQEFVITAKTLGCRLNQAETDSLLSQFSSFPDFIIKQNPSKADVVLLNTCTVTAPADAKSRNTIRHLRRVYKNALFVITGCYAETDSPKIRQIDDKAIIIANHNKSALVSTVRSYLTTGRLALTYRTTKEPFFYLGGAPMIRSRAFVKIQDGCNSRCSYCKVPLARGSSVSADPKQILQYIQELDKQGVPEIVLTGINLGKYWAMDSSKKRVALEDLIERILEQLTFSRIRLSSIEPRDLTKKICRLSNHPLFCNFFHLPIQSGSEKILKLMQRPSKKKVIQNKLDLLFSVNPDVFLSADIMIGFPGETEDDFIKTEELITRYPFAGLHIFPYSPRNGTIAYSLKERRPSNNELNERIKRLREIEKNLFLAYASRFLGTSRRAVVLKSKTDGFGRALTDNNLSLIWKQEGNSQNENRIMDFSLISLQDRKILSKPLLSLGVAG